MIGRLSQVAMKQGMYRPLGATSRTIEVQVFMKGTFGEKTI